MCGVFFTCTDLSHHGEEKREGNFVFSPPPPHFPPHLAFDTERRAFRIEQCSHSWNKVFFRILISWVVVCLCIRLSGAESWGLGSFRKGSCWHPGLRRSLWKHSFKRCRNKSDDMGYCHWRKAVPFNTTNEIKYRSKGSSQHLCTYAFYVISRITNFVWRVRMRVCMCTYLSVLLEKHS